jgi:hypothetical protein
MSLLRRVNDVIKTCSSLDGLLPLNLNVLLGPQTPYTEVISMDGYIESDVLMNAFIRNLIHSNIQLTVDCWKGIINFYAGDHCSLSFGIQLQLLLLFSKADVLEYARVMHDDYSVSLNENLFYLNSFCVAELSHLESVIHKSYILRPIVLQAFQVVLHTVLGCDVSVDEIKRVIVNMKIYIGRSYFTLRGATLRDGVFMNLNHMCHSPLAAVTIRADRTTLLAHEAAHYLVRMLTNNYNFSSPYTGVGLHAAPRMDQIMSEKVLEGGRLLELTLFGGKQPAWNRSTAQSADTFLHLLDECRALPLPNIGFVARPSPSLSFGIDFEFEKDEFVLE